MSRVCPECTIGHLELSDVETYTCDVCGRDFDAADLSATAGGGPR